MWLGSTLLANECPSGTQDQRLPTCYQSLSDTRGNLGVPLGFKSSSIIRKSIHLVIKAQTCVDGKINIQLPSAQS